MRSTDRWQPDGWGWRARIGVIDPHADLVPEAELSAMAPDGVAIHATRVYFAAMDTDPKLGEPVELAALQAYLQPPLLDDAAALLAGGPVSVIAYAFTSTCYLGHDGDDDTLRARLEHRTGTLRVVTTCTAAVHAIRSLDVERIALIHPPWISGELNAMGAAYFRRQGLDVVFASPAVLAGGQHDIRPGDVYEWARANVPDDADAIFFGGNGFRVVGAIERLERDLQRPVLSANQALLWAALQVAGVTAAPITGYGQLLADGRQEANVNRRRQAGG
jgi:maleate isomerase